MSNHIKKSQSTESVSIKENEILDERSTVPKWFVYANTLFFSMIYFLTEGLSLFHGLNKKNARIFFAGILFALIFLVVYLVKKKRIVFQWGEYFKKKNKCGEKGIYALVLLPLLIVLLVFAVAVATCNWDSMTYHCSRIMNWVQNESVGYYSTNIKRQLYSPPLAEYALLQIYLILGNDMLFNVLQWYSYVACGAMIYWILRFLQARKEIAVLGATLFFTMPIAIAESITTQNDVFASMWILFFVYLILDFSIKEKIDFSKDNIVELLMLSFVLGMGYISKSQILIPMGLLTIWLFVICLKKKVGIGVLGGCSFVAAIGSVVPFMIPMFVRNYRLCGNILAMEYFANIPVGTKKPNYLLINFLKNLVQTSKSKRFTGLNRFMINRVIGLAHLLNVDIDDKSINFIESYQFVDQYIGSYHCDNATAPLVGWAFSIAALIGLGLGIYYFIKKKEFANKGLVVTLFLSIVSVMTYLKWQPWGSRILVPVYALMILFAMMIAEVAIANYKNKSGLKFVIQICMVVFVLYAIPVVRYQKLYFDKNVSAEERYEAYFCNRNEYSEYKELTDYVLANGYKNIGIFLSNDSFEYPLWYALKNDETKLLQVTNGNTEGEVPECIIAIHVGGYEIGKELNYMDANYVSEYCANDNADYSVLVVK